MPFGEEEAGQREQRNRRQRRRDAERVGLDENRRRRHAVVQIEERRGAAENREQRGADQGGDDDHDRCRPDQMSGEQRRDLREEYAGNEADRCQRAVQPDRWPGADRCVDLDSRRGRMPDAPYQP